MRIEIRQKASFSYSGSAVTPQQQRQPGGKCLSQQRKESWALGDGRRLGLSCLGGQPVKESFFVFL